MSGRIGDGGWERDGPPEQPEDLQKHRDEHQQRTRREPNPARQGRESSADEDRAIEADLANRRD